MAGTYNLRKIFPNIGSRCSSSCKYLFAQNNRINLPTVYQARYAGHAKWQNIAHTKAANDKAKSQLISKLAMQIRTAIKDGGSASPVGNYKLAAAIEKAKSLKMPIATIQRILDRALMTNKDGKEFLLEYRAGISGISLKVLAFTDNQRRVKSLLVGCTKKYGYEEIKSGSFFNQRGLVVVSLGDDKEITLDQAEEYAIEAGAEEVELVEGNEIKFDCAGEDLFSVLKSLKTQGLNVTASGVTHVPVSYVTANEQELKTYDKVIGKMMEVEGVDEVLSNLENL